MPTFEVDPELGQAVAEGFHLTAAAMYLQLAKIRGNGPWVEELRQSLRYQAATMEAPEGSDPEVAEKWPEAAMMAVDHIFDYVKFETKRPRR